MMPASVGSRTSGLWVFLRLASAGLAVALSVLAITDRPVRAASSTIVISEFRVRGPNGGNDEFVELYNLSAAPVNIGGWKVKGSNNAAGFSTRATITAAVILSPGCHYLLTNSTTSAGPYSGGVPGNQTYPTGITDDGGIALTMADDTFVDQVGMSAGSAYKEGTILSSLGTSNLNRGYERKPGGAAGSSTDTDNNSTDFQLISPSDPQNLSSACVAIGLPTGVGAASPAFVTAADSTLLTVTVTPGANPVSTGLAVAADLSSIGGAPGQTFYDNATSGDVTAGDHVFSFLATVVAAAPSGAKSLPFTVADAQSRSTSGTIALTVTPAPIAIHDIQGPGLTSTYAGQLVTTRGVVTGRRFNNGFFIQTPDALADADPSTSEGIFVFTSSAPPAAASVGVFVQVTGTVQEYIPSADPSSPPMTEIADGPLVSVRPESYPMPMAMTLSQADLTVTNTLANLERLEGMRAHVDALRVVGPTLGSISEANATSTSNGVFFGVIDGQPRPFREPGIDALDPLPAGAPAGVPRFDGNPERLRVDSDGQIGASRIEVTAGALVSNLTGPLDFSSRTWTILPDPVAPPEVSGLVNATPVPVPDTTEFTVASFNLERFYDTANDPLTSDVVLTPTAFANRLSKASLAIRTVMRTPDILGVEEVENLSTLQALAAKINTDAVAAGDPDPGYQAYLEEGNDVGGIDVGLLVKTLRVTVIDVTQEGKDATYINPLTGLPEMLNDRPPLVLRADMQGPSGQLPVTVIVNHLRSLSGVDAPADGPRVRAKRAAQAEFLASLIQTRQMADPTERTVSVGDYNAFQVSDGYVDVMGTIKGTPTAADQVVLASPDLVSPDLTDLVDLSTAEQRYSYVFDGTAQVLDHVLVNDHALPRLSRFHYARFDADFPESYRSDATRPERLSDHDAPVAFFVFPPAPMLALAGANPMAVECCTSFTEPGYSATDVDFGDLTSQVVVAGSVDPHAVGAYSLTYAVSNGYLTTTMTRTVNVVDTTPPALALLGANPLTVEVGSGFADPGATATDSCAGDLTAAIQVSGTVNPSQVGTYQLAYTVSDGYNTASVTRTVFVVDTTTPVITGFAPAVPSLWPPNHKMVNVAFGYAVSDNSGAATCSLGVTSNEPDNGTGDGDTAPDWSVLDARTVQLRAERAGTGEGRTYTVSVTCRDASGNASVASATVRVPKNQGK